MSISINQNVISAPISLSGRSAYQSYLATTEDEPKMTEAAWLASLKGDPGNKGDQGETGTAFLAGSGGPSPSLGVNGDFYFDQASGVVWRKSGGVWAVVSAPTNSILLSGTGVPAAGLGANGDHYVRYVGGVAAEFHGKSGGAWAKLADFAQPVAGLTLGQVEADRRARTAQEWTCIGVLSSSGGDSQAVVFNGGVGGQISPGTSPTGYGRMLLAGAVTGFPGVTGTGILYTRPLELDFALCPALTSAANGGRIRLVFSEAGSGTPINAASNALAARGFGLEFAYISGQPDVRLFAHNGTTYVTSAWYGSQAGNSNQMVAGRIASDGAGNLALYLAVGLNVNQGPPAIPATPALTLAGGPTASGPQTVASVSWLAVADGTNAPATGSCVARLLLSKLRVTGI